MNAYFPDTAFEITGTFTVKWHGDGTFEVEMELEPELVQVVIFERL